MGTRKQWAIDFAAALGNGQPSASLLSWISAWEAKENTRATFNPLATTYDLPPNTNFNGAGVKNYTTRNQGIEATVRTLRGAHPGYADIIKGIVQNDPQTAANGLLVAPWGTNGAAVMALWKTSDVGNGLLPAESGTETATPQPVTPGNVPLHTPERIPLGGVNGLGPEIGDAQDTVTVPANDTTTAIRAVYIGGGAIAVIIAIVLAVKTYVPITQVVKTVAAVTA